MNNRILVCTDLDHTLLPNGKEPESHGARQRFARLARHGEVSLAYVTGRHRELVLEAIEQYRLPAPDYVIGDVGTSIYELEAGHWRLWEAWEEEIAVDWNGCGRGDLERLFSDLGKLRLQEAERQNVFKLSYYAPEETDIERLRETMQERLRRHDIRASLIWSIDHLKHIGLLDVLPEQATKLHAVEFLMQNKGYAIERTVFAGDSGNDLPVLVSPIRSVLVANATESVREHALSLVEENGLRHAFYLARGNFLGMNGNYAAGILEGVVHYLPETLDWIADRPSIGQTVLPAT